jgi:hypothetical protein
MANAREENLRSYSADSDASIGIYTGVPGLPGSALPNSGKQFCALKITGENQVGLAVAAGDNYVGILQNKPQKPGEAATVGYHGLSQATAGAAITAGAEVIPDATGRFIPGHGTGVGKKFLAHSVASVAGELFTVQII